MTRQEWEDSIEDIGDLVSFSNETGYQDSEYCDVIDDYGLDDCISEDIRYYDGSWQSLRDALDSIETGYDWYKREGCLDYTGLDSSDYRDMKEEMLQELIDDDFFDEEDADEDGADEEQGAGYVGSDYHMDRAPKWRCFATAGSSIPSFDTQEMSASVLFSVCQEAADSVVNREKPEEHLPVPGADELCRMTMDRQSA